MLTVYFGVANLLHPAPHQRRTLGLFRSVT
jgi:hypothetical protein